MERILVVGDIHGGFKALTQVFKIANISNNDQLIFLGDYVDGWSESPQVIDFLINLKQTNACIFIRGNHDVYLLNYLKNGDLDPTWLMHGGSATVNSYETLSKKTIFKHIQFLEELHSYYLDSVNRLFLHAGFTHMRGVDFERYNESFYWDRTLWETAVALNTNINKDSDLYPKRFKLYNEIYIGHTPTTHISSTIPTQKANIWNIDTGAAFNGKLSILNINNKEFWQSNSLPNLYPNEKGRNH
ncbi:serine/threonine protein phosphatase [Apibacter muscae]|uniref:Serine/threonine protein phosphatase n=1 Tax=Apibacter muscae TaxID=2509004 RepID=A0A563DHK5_9FLAO|nr:metallophosphoesterase [Apibacter muscae]TWP29294.1 serine/threonine protein phosphatase [Apibacter muscae]